MKPNIVFGLTDIACALMIIGVSIPLVKRKIKMNRWYGVRLKKSFESDENWYEINAYGGRQLIIWSLALIAVGIILLFIPLDDPNKDFTALALGAAPVLVFMVVPIVKIFRFAGKL